MTDDVDRWMRHAEIVAAVRLYYRRRALLRPVPGWWLR